MRTVRHITPPVLKLLLWLKNIFEMVSNMLDHIRSDADYVTWGAHLGHFIAEIPLNSTVQ